MEMRTLRRDTLRDRIRNEDIRDIREIQDVNWSDDNRLAKIAKHEKHLQIIWSSETLARKSYINIAGEQTG